MPAKIQAPSLQLVDKNAPKRCKPQVEAGDLIECVRADIVYHFTRLGSTRKVAKMYNLSARVIADVILLHLRRGPKPDLSLARMPARREDTAARSERKGAA